MKNKMDKILDSIFLDGLLVLGYIVLFVWGMLSPDEITAKIVYCSLFMNAFLSACLFFYKYKARKNNNDK